MFNDYYGLTFNPFDKDYTEKSPFPSHDYTEASSRLTYLSQVRGIGLITASPGFGKSYVLRCFQNSLNPNLYRIEYICLSTVTVGEFYKAFCGLLGVSDKGGKPGRFRAIQEQVYDLYHEKRKPLILEIDEAQYLNTSILTDLKLLMNFGCDSLNCCTIILCGEPYLNDTLNKPIHESLRQRITVHYNFVGLSDKEVSAYILHKIRKAGGADSIIDPAALASVHGYAGGNPRIIDNIMSDAITIGSQQQRQTIDSEIILAAVNNQHLG